MRLLGAFLVWLSLAVAAHATCVPSQATVGMMGCQPAASSMADTDYLETWLPGSFPNSAQIITRAAMLGGLRVANVPVDGTTSADAALSAAVAACAGGSLIIPPGKIALTGAATTTLSNCALVCPKVPAASSGSTASFGATFILTSTSVQPFIAKSNWSISGCNFYWPNQTTGAVVYPPLVTDNGVDAVHLVNLDHVTILNAYDGFVQNGDHTNAVDWSTFHISNSSMYAMRDLFKIGSSGDSWHFTGVHFTYAPLADLIDSGTLQTVVNYADQRNSIFHVPDGRGFVPFVGNAASFAWQWLVKVDSGGIMNDGIIQGGFDGVQYFADTSSGGCLNGMLFTGAGWDSYTADIATGVPYGNGAAFNLGASGASCNGPYIKDFLASRVNGSFLVSAGQNVELQNVAAPIGMIGDGGDYYVAHVTASTGTNITVQGSLFAGDGTAHAHGVTNDVAVSAELVDGNRFRGMNEALSLVTGPTPAQFINNNVTGTVDTASIVVSGTDRFFQSGNVVDKITAPAVSGCGTGASIASGSGPLSGFIQVGSTNPTTACVLTFSWAPIFGACNFTTTVGAFVAIASVSGNVWTLGTSADVHGAQIFYTCSS